MKRMGIGIQSSCTALILVLAGLFCFSQAAGQPVIGRWPSLSDGPPSQRRAPIAWISNQKNDERQGWEWTIVENVYPSQSHWQHDVKIEDDRRSKAIHGNKNNHRLQVGEPAIYEIAGGYRLKFYIKHDRKGRNPILGFVVYINNGSVSSIEMRSVYEADPMLSFSADLMKKGLNVGVDSVLSWATEGGATAFGQTWRLLDALLPTEWMHRYRGWERDAMWFAVQIGYLYARALPVR
jgi:hypothetical protein